MKSAMHKSWAIAIFAALALSACSTQPGTIFRTLTFDDGKSFTTGARQRLISNIEPGVASRPGQVDPQRIVCVEPSPDVAIAVANSFGAGLSILGQGSGSISGAQAEGIAQLAERTVAIQALLKQGYQACLDYGNGAINGTTYSLRTSRLDDLMVTLILAEVAGGAFGRSGAAIGTKASASASAKLMEGLREDFDTAKAELAKENQKVADAEAKLTEAETATPQVPDDVKTAKAELKVAKAERDAARQLMTASADTAAQAAAEASEIIALGSLTAKPTAAIAKELGLMQERFIDVDPSKAWISACMIELGGTRLDASSYDKRFLEETVNLIEGGDRSDQTIGDFFLATNIGSETELTGICKDTLAEFIENVRDDRQTVRLKELDIESKRLDLLSRQAATEAAKPAVHIHPLASYKSLVDDDNALKAQKVNLAAATNPAASAGFSAADRQDLVAEKSTLSQVVDATLAQAATALATPKKAETDQIEANYLSLVTDPARNASPSERKLWKLKFGAQQASAKLMAEEIARISKKVNGASEEVVAFIKLISAIK